MLLVVVGYHFRRLYTDISHVQLRDLPSSFTRLTSDEIIIKFIYIYKYFRLLLLVTKYIVHAIAFICWKKFLFLPLSYFRLFMIRIHLVMMHSCSHNSRSINDRHTCHNNDTWISRIILCSSLYSNWWVLHYNSFVFLKVTCQFDKNLLLFLPHDDHNWSCNHDL